MSDGDQGRLAGPRVLLVLARGGRQEASVEEDGPGQRRVPVAGPAPCACADGVPQAPTVRLGAEIPTHALRFVWKLSRFVDE